MEELIKRIDEALEKNAWGISTMKRPQYDKGRYDMAYECLRMVRDIVKQHQSSQSDGQQKEPCKYCENEILTVKMEFSYDSYMGKDGWVSSTRHPKVCPMCGRKLIS